MAQLMPLPLTVSCFSKIQIGFTFLVPAHLGSPGQRAVKQMCVCIIIIIIFFYIPQVVKIPGVKIVIIIIIIKGIYIAQVRKGHKCAMSAEMAVLLRNCLYLYSYLHN